MNNDQLLAHLLYAYLIYKLGQASMMKDNTEEEKSDESA